MMEETLQMRNKVYNHFNDKKLNDSMLKKLEKLDYIIVLYNDTETVEFYEKSKKYLMYVINDIGDVETGEKLLEILYKKFSDLVIDYKDNINSGYNNTYEKIPLSTAHPSYDTVSPDDYNDVVYKYNELLEDYDDMFEKYNSLAHIHNNLVKKYFNEDH